MSMSLSARNQLSCEITEVKTGAVNSQISTKLSNGEILRANVTVESEKNLNLKSMTTKVPSYVFLSYDLAFTPKTTLDALIDAVTALPTSNFKFWQL